LLRLYNKSISKALADSFPELEPRQGISLHNSLAQLPHSPSSISTS